MHESGPHEAPVFETILRDRDGCGCVATLSPAKFLATYGIAAGRDTRPALPPRLAVAAEPREGYVLSFGLLAAVLTFWGFIVAALIIYLR